MPKVFPSAARLSWSFKTRGFLSPSREEFSLIENYLGSLIDMRIC
jgi:hypothetical protein